MENNLINRRDGAPTTGQRRPTVIPTPRPNDMFPGWGVRF
jgi:hypothetical protein